MGCDIHIRVEYKSAWDAEWTDGDYYRRNPYLERFEGEDKFSIVGIYDHRNYMLFALLADVRNYYRFAPICQPKGVPDDCCESVREAVDYWDEDGHSHSHFTLKELIEWYASHEQAFKVTGYISPVEARKLEQNGELPTNWCAWTSDKTWVERTWTMKVDVLKPLITRLGDRAKDLFYLPENYDFEKDEREIANNIRIVFWFDN